MFMAQFSAAFSALFGTFMMGNWDVTIALLLAGFVMFYYGYALVRGRCGSRIHNHLSRLRASGDGNDACRRLPVFL